MTDLWTRLRQRKLVQWVVAYVAGAWAGMQVMDLAADSYHWPDLVMHAAFGALALGLVITLLLAWYHGERGAQKVTGVELLLLAGVFAIGGFLIWHYAGSGSPPTNAGHAPASAVAASTAMPKPTPATSIPAKSIAVLPFENLSSDKNNAYFADGMQDLILTKLADIGDLAVISRTSTMKYGSHPEDLKTVGQQLGVATILEGSVQKVGDQVLVNVQLIDARNDHHIWAESYTRTLKNVFSVEGEVAQKIADTLKAKLSPAETQRLATTLSGNTAANDLYLQGKYFANRANINYDTAAMKKAIAFYRQAIAKAPDFAQARAHLSYTESQLAWFGGGGENTAPLYADALSQAEQAIKLAPNLADAHLALGYYYYWGKGEYPAALKAFAAALARRPNASDVMAAKAYVLRRQGKFDKAIDVFQKALTLDPRNTLLAAEMAGTYMATRQYAQAEQAFRHALALDPANINARVYLAQTIAYRSGDLSTALAQVQGDNPRLTLARVDLLVLDRRYDQALKLLQSVPHAPSAFTANNHGTKFLLLAYLHELRGQPAKARAYYAKALPQARAHFMAMAGSTDTNQAIMLIEVARAEMGLGRTKTGLAATAKVLSIVEHGNDHLYSSLLMERCAERYVQAGRTDKAVQVLSEALATPGIGMWYSPIMLWLDPGWDPIRKTPAFRALQRKYAKYRPAVLPVPAKS
jgi:TolB-like protein/Tfp pilus assembly protein PilF